MLPYGEIICNWILHLSFGWLMIGCMTNHIGYTSDGGASEHRRYLTAIGIDPDDPEVRCESCRVSAPVSRTVSTLDGRICFDCMSVYASEAELTRRIGVGVAG